MPTVEVCTQCEMPESVTNVSVGEYEYVSQCNECGAIEQGTKTVSDK